MRHVNQLGTAGLVYPSATHTRFAHSLGVGFLAKEALEKLGKKMYQLHRDLDRICVIVAALCHDVGHPAFSHSFEHFM
ncbi:unnamed protein product, partial [Amoebophrya sp. A25]|eukprot:GSA25T00021752001.1